VDEDSAEWRFAVGGQIETSSHGLFDLGWRRGPLSIELFTETLSVRWRPALPGGQVTVGLRGSAVASNLWITPWSQGAPDLTRAQTAQAVGPELRVERWGPHGTWAALEGFARYHAFQPIPGSTLPVDDTPWLSGAAAVGVWDERGASARIAGGVDWTTSARAPFVRGEAALSPVGGRFAPFAELRAGPTTSSQPASAASRRTMCRSPARRGPSSGSRTTSCPGSAQSSA
jgi:hypothetical protein